MNLSPPPSPSFQFITVLSSSLASAFSRLLRLRYLNTPSRLRKPTLSTPPNGSPYYLYREGRRSLLERRPGMDGEVGKERRWEWRVRPVDSYLKLYMKTYRLSRNFLREAELDERHEACRETERKKETSASGRLSTISSVLVVLLAFGLSASTNSSCQDYESQRCSTPSNCSIAITTSLLPSPPLRIPHLPSQRCNFGTQG